MRTIFICLLGAALLAGCSTPAEQASQMEREAERMTVVYGPACVRLGYTAESDKWRDCILNLATKDDLQRYEFRSFAYPDCTFYGCPRRF